MPGEPRFPMPDWSRVHRELRRKGVTLALLWQEYKAVHPEGMQYSWFCKLYRAWTGKLDVVMRQAGPHSLPHAGSDSLPPHRSPVMRQLCQHRTQAVVPEIVRAHPMDVKHQIPGPELLRQLPTSRIPAPRLNRSECLVAASILFMATTTTRFARRAPRPSRGGRTGATCGGARPVRAADCASDRGLGGALRRIGRATGCRGARETRRDVRLRVRAGASEDAGKSFRFVVTMTSASARMAAARTWRSSGSGSSRDGTRSSNPVTRTSRTWASMRRRVRSRRAAVRSGRLRRSARVHSSWTRADHFAR